MGQNPGREFFVQLVVFSNRSTILLSPTREPAIAAVEYAGPALPLPLRCAAQAHLTGAESLLDTGCGFGHLAWYLAEIGAPLRYFDVDTDKRKIDLALGCPTSPTFNSSTGFYSRRRHRDHHSASGMSGISRLAGLIWEYRITGRNVPDCPLPSWRALARLSPGPGKCSFDQNHG